MWSGTIVWRDLGLIYVQEEKLRRTMENRREVSEQEVVGSESDLSEALTIRFAQETAFLPHTMSFLTHSTAPIQKYSKHFKKLPFNSFHHLRHLLPHPAPNATSRSIATCPTNPNLLMPEKLLSKVAFIHQEHALEKLLDQITGDDAQRHRQSTAAQRKSKAERFAQRQQMSKIRREKMKKLIEKLQNHDAYMNNPLLRNMKNETLYSSYLYLKCMRKLHKLDFAWDFMEDTFFSEWMGVRSEVCNQLLSFPVNRSSAEMELLVAHQRLLFAECLRHLMHRNDDDRTIEFLGMFFLREKDVGPMVQQQQEEATKTAAFEKAEEETAEEGAAEEDDSADHDTAHNIEEEHPNTPVVHRHRLLYSSPIIGQLYALAAQSSPRVASYIIRVTRYFLYQLNFTDSELSLIYRTLIQNGKAKYAIHYASARAPEHKKYRTGELSLVFDELMRVPSEENASFVLNIYGSARYARNTTNFLKHPKIVSAVSQAFIDKDNLDGAIAHFETEIMPRLEHDLVFPRDSYHLMMPLLYSLAEMSEWKKAAHIATKTLLQPKPLAVVHPEVLYIAAAVLNHVKKPQKVLELAERYATGTQSWKFVVELVRAHGALHDTDACINILNAETRDVRRVDENTEILAHVLRALVANDKMLSATEILQEYTSSVVSKQKHLPYIPRTIRAVLPVLRHYTKDPPSLLYLLDQVWPEALYDPAPLVQLLENVRETVADNATKNQISQSIERLKEEREKFLLGTETVRILVGGK